jgi:undecaprenyl diphosphate synthase
MQQEISSFIPNHVGIIMDGNRRWAKKNNLSTLEGHQKGFSVLQSIGDYALDGGIKNLTVYAFSTENWAREKEEVAFIFSFLSKMLKKEIKKFHERGIRFNWLGTAEKMNPKIVKQLKEAEELTKNNTNGSFNLCVNYGGHTEIVESVNKIIKLGKRVTIETINKALYGGDSVPPIDLVIRTSGEQRISNFMLWRIAYSELYFTNICWPEFKNSDWDEAINFYISRQRRYGK